MFMIFSKIDFSNSQRTITGITLFPDEELFIFALYIPSLQQQFPYLRFLLLFEVIILVFSVKLWS